MSRKPRYGTLPVWVAGVALAAACHSGPSAPPSLVLITIDTIRADRLGCYGYTRPTSPALDRFAGDAVLFENAITPSGFTLPAHVSLMTGTRPSRHGVRGNFERMHIPLDGRAGLRTLAQLLAEQGYRTAAFVSAAPVKDHTGLNLGFALFDQPEEHERRAGETTDRVLAWLDGAHDEPYFLWIHYFDPHGPYDPPAPFDARFTTDEELIGLLRAKAVIAWDDEEIQRHNNLYDGEVLYLDGQLDRLFTALRRRDDWSDTAVLLTGDHGEGLGQHDWLTHGRIHNEQLFVPLIVRLPAGSEPRGARVDRPASLVDVVPTLLGILDLPVSPETADQIQGFDLLDGRGGPAFVISEQLHPRLGTPQRFSVTGSEWKYFQVAHGRDELFDMRTDRIETRNVIDAHPRMAQELAEQLQRILDLDARLVEQHAPAEIPEERIEELRQLGYVEEEGDVSRSP